MSTQTFFTYHRIIVPGEDYVIEGIEHKVQYNEKGEMVRSDAVVSLLYLDGDVSNKRISYHAPDAFGRLQSNEFYLIETGEMEDIVQILLNEGLLVAGKPCAFHPMRPQKSMRPASIVDDTGNIPTTEEVRTFLADIYDKLPLHEANRAFGLIQRMRLSEKEKLRE